MRSPLADRILKDGDVVSIKGCDFEIIHTPGHTHGGICLFCKTREGELPPCCFQATPFLRMVLEERIFPAAARNV